MPPPSTPPLCRLSDDKSLIYDSSRWRKAGSRPVRGDLKQSPGEDGKFGMSGKNWDRVPIDAQSIDAPLSLAAVFLVVTVASEQAALAKVSSVLDGLDDLVKTVGFRDLSGRLSCIAGIGRDLWDRLDSGK